MPIKKSNLSPDVKSKLRRAVLGEIGDQDKKPVAVSQPHSSLIKKSAPKILAASVDSEMEETLEKPISKSAVSQKKPAKKAKIKLVTKKPVIKKSTKKISQSKTAKSEEPTETVTISAVESAKKPKFGNFYSSNGPKNQYKPAWERVKKEDKSLEEFFKKSTSKMQEKKPGFLTGVLAKKSASPAQPITPKSSSFWSGLVKILGLIILLLVLLFAFDVFGVYRLGFRDPISLNIVKYLPLPAGQVNDQLISANAYLDDLKNLSLPISAKREGLIDYSNMTEIGDKVFYRLAANQLVEEKLRTYQKDITSTDLENQVQLLVQQAGGRDQAEKIVKDLYGLNLVQFSVKIMAPMMRRERLQAAIINDQSLVVNLEAMALADEVLNRAQATSSDFNVLAQKYTQDEAGVNTGGELGWVVKGQLDPEWESLIFNASSSTVLPQLVKSNFGYHIIKVEQKLLDKSTNEESVRIKHILIKVDVDKYIKSLLDGASLVKYIK